MPPRYGILIVAILCVLAVFGLLATCDTRFGMPGY